MKKTDWIWIPVVLAVFGLAGINQGVALESDSPAAPDFTLEDLKGNEISLNDYKGKVLFLNFWATWCGPCRREIPDFIEAYDEYGDDGLEILGVSVDQGSQKKIVQFVEAYKINYPVVMYTNQLVRDYQPGNYIPSTIIIDREGKIRHKQIGLMSKDLVVDLFLRFSKED
jgi:cytochrome c biogenesis protein CcmG/thiol:disulfide interchange protein DsbE